LGPGRSIGVISLENCGQKIADFVVAAIMQMEVHMHVIVNYDEDFEYIIPICDDHREISETFSVNSDTLAVRVDKEEIITELVENLVEK
jgi:hypothetical protein